MGRRAHVCPAFVKHMAGIRKGASYIIHFFLQLRKTCRGSARCSSLPKVTQPGTGQGCPSYIAPTGLGGRRPAPPSPNSGPLNSQALQATWVPQRWVVWAERSLLGRTG